MKKQLLFILLTLLVAIALFNVVDNEKDEYKIAFVAGITGKYTSLGIQERDGFLLAVEEINAAGGINGKKIEYAIYDDKQDADTIKEIFKKIKKDREIEIVIGPATSSMGKEMIDQIKDAKFTVVSPTVSSDFFNDKDDNFIRFGVPENSNTIAAMVQDMDSRGFKKALMIYDEKNSIYSKDWTEKFEELFSKFGVVTVLGIDSEGEYVESVLEKMGEGYDVVVMATNSLATAKIVQTINKEYKDISFYSSGSAFSQDLITHGGNAIEGLIINSIYNSLSKEPQFLKFKKSYEARFGIAPEAYSLRAYDVVHFIKQTLEKNPDASSLKETLLGIGKFQGLQNEFELNRYGDVINHKEMLLTIKDGEFEKIEP